MCHKFVCVKCRRATWGECAAEIPSIAGVLGRWPCAQRQGAHSHATQLTNLTRLLLELVPRWDLGLRGARGRPPVAPASAACCHRCRLPTAAAPPPTPGPCRRCALGAVGCGKHIDYALEGVPEDKRCHCKVGCRRALPVRSAGQCRTLPWQLTCARWLPLPAGLHPSHARRGERRRQLLGAVRPGRLAAVSASGWVAAQLTA